VNGFGVVVRTSGATLVRHRDPADLRALMLDADVAVTAAGQTMLQLAATGTPVVALALHDDQREQLATLEALGAVRAVGRADAGVASRLEAALADLRHVDTRARLGRMARAVVDGGGAARVAAHVARRVVGERVVA
jgi:spore coat polysaccharide biosynthesis predicted glycosyltransferase SpsG